MEKIAPIFFKATGLKPASKKCVSRKVLGDYDAVQGQSLTDGGSLLLHSAQGNNFIVVVPGGDCLQVEDWKRFVLVFSELQEIQISRLDLALDVENGLTLNDVSDAHESGYFAVRGKNPLILHVGNFVKDDGNARTITIGKRANGKMLRVYEIGRKLSKNPKAVRLEVEFHGDKRRKIQFEALTDPLPFFCGAYPYLEQFGDGRFKVTDLRRKERNSDVLKAIANLKHSHGPLLNLMLKGLKGNAQAVLDLAIRSGYPKGMSLEDFEIAIPVQTYIQRNDAANQVANQPIDSIYELILDIKNEIRISRVPAITPRLIRLRDAPNYLGMDRNRFNAEVRPYLTEIPIGEQGIAFDRLEMDDWAEHYKQRNGRPGRKEGNMTWDVKNPLDSTCVKGSGILTSSSEEFAFAKALDAVNSQKRKCTSRKN
jgi:hypothetical protein